MKQFVQSASFCPHRKKALHVLKVSGWRWSDELDPKKGWSTWLPEWVGLPAVYAFWDGCSCRYVGATGNLSSRLFASLAERCARDTRAPWVVTLAACSDAASAFASEAWAIAALRRGLNRLRPAWSPEAAILSGRWLLAPANRNAQGFVASGGHAQIEATLARMSWARMVRDEQIAASDAKRQGRRAAALVRLGDMIEARADRLRRAASPSVDDETEWARRGGFRHLVVTPDVMKVRNR